MKAPIKQLITLAVGLATVFACTFLLIKASGVLTVDDIRAFLSRADEITPLYVAAAVFVLLVADLFIAVPTLTVIILAGHFLGFPLGFLAGAGGLLSAGLLGYLITYIYGPGFLRRIHKDSAAQEEMNAIFTHYGVAVLMVCRALPILPEVSCCLAGATRMRFRKFILAFLIGTLPYAAIATYAGSRSSLEAPQPAIFTAIGLSLLLGSVWIMLIRKYRAQRRNDDLLREKA